MQESTGTRDVHTVFDGLAARYDTANRIMSMGRDHTWRRALARAVPFTAGTLIDLACGTGDQLYTFARILRHSPRHPAAEHYALPRFIGIDTDPGMLQQAQKKRPVPDIHMEWHCRDAVQTGLPPACADAVSCSFGLRNMQNRQALYREIRRLLKPQARTGLLEFSVPPTGLRRHLYLCYLRHVLPWIGAMVSGRVTPYRYLSRTIQQFPPPERIVHELVTAGFADVQTSPLDGAIVTMYTACI